MPPLLACLNYENNAIQIVDLLTSGGGSGTWKSNEESQLMQCTLRGDTQGCSFAKLKCAQNVIDI